MCVRGCIFIADVTFFFMFTKLVFISLYFLGTLEINVAILHFHFLHINKKKEFFLHFISIDWREEAKNARKHWFVASQNMCTIGVMTKSQTLFCIKITFFVFLMFCNHIIKLSSTFTYERLYFSTCLKGTISRHTCITHTHVYRAFWLHWNANKQTKEYIKWE